MPKCSQRVSSRWFSISGSIFWAARQVQRYRTSPNDSPYRPIVLFRKKRSADSAEWATSTLPSRYFCSFGQISGKVGASFTISSVIP